MGNETSTSVSQEHNTLNIDPYEGDIEENDSNDNGGKYYGYRVLGIQENSPASRANFVSFFDFILIANGIRLDHKDSTFMELIAQNEDQELHLKVYNMKSQTTRDVQLLPSRKWPGKGLLGVTIRFDSYEHAEEQLLHVLDVIPGSPASHAGLIPDLDFILGTPERVFHDPDDLQDELIQFYAINEGFQCYVYNVEKDQVRIILITPSENWGHGDEDCGLLGADIAHGCLHRLPSSCRSTIGVSVGYIRLHEDAKAATDPYVRKHSLQKNDIQSQSSNDVKEMEEDIVGDIAENIEIQNSESLTTAGIEENTEDLHEKLDVNAVKEAEGNTKAVAPNVLIEEIEVKKQPLRYTARTDARFPMSTVEVVTEMHAFQ